METDLTSATSIRHSGRRLWPWLVILVVIMLAGFMRFRLLEMPLERDEGEYAYAGQLILQGIPPYELACNLKLPGTYYAYAIGMAIFGQTVSGIHLTLLIVNSLIILFVYLLGRKLFGVTAGLVAGTCYGVISISPAVLGMAAHANFFVILFAVPGTHLLWNAIEINSKKTLFFSGLLFGLAFVMKQQGVFFGLFGLLAFTVALFKGKSFTVASIFQTQIGVRLIKGGLIFVFGMALPYVVTCLYLASAGVFSKFWFWTFTYAHTYVTAVSWSEGEYMLDYHLGATSMQSFGLWLTALVGVLFGLREPQFRRQTLFVTGFWIFSLLATATGLYFRRHYFILLLPPFALLAGLGVVMAQAELHSKMRPHPARLVPLAIFAGLLGWNIFCQAQILFQLSPEQTCQQVYRENPFVEAPLVAKYIREHASPNARIIVVGSEPEIYFYTRIHSATAYLYGTDLMQVHPYAMKMQGEMMRDIESNQPEYLVFVSYDNSWCVQAGSNQGFFDWFDKYAAEFYDQVGVVSPLPDGEIACLWDDAARTNSPPAGHYLAVYKRKSQSGRMP